MLTTRDGNDALRCLATSGALAALLTIATTAAAVDLPILKPTSEITYDAPRIEGYRVDWCESWSTNCGKSAADRFCFTERGRGSIAKAFSPAPGIGKQSPTRTLLDRKVCAESFCGGFQSITCDPPDVVVAEDPEPKSVCHYDKSKTWGVGKESTARGEIVGHVEARRPEDKRESRIEGKLRGCLGGSCQDFAKVGAEALSNGASRVYYQYWGDKVHSDSLSARGGKDYGPYPISKDLSGKVTIVPGVKASVKANFSAGIEFHAGYDIRPLPPVADLDATVKTFGNATGEAKLSLLYDVIGWAKAEGTLVLPSPDVIVDVDSRACGAKADARLEIKSYKLQLGASYGLGCDPSPLGLGCVKKGSKILINETGSHKVYHLF